MIGSGWEWTTDWYQARAETSHACCTVDSPRRGDQEQSYDPQLPGVRIPRRVMKGSSHLCAPSYCRRYRRRPACRKRSPVNALTVSVPKVSWRARTDIA